LFPQACGNGRRKNTGHSFQCRLFAGVFIQQALYKNNQKSFTQKTGYHTFYEQLQPPSQLPPHPQPLEVFPPVSPKYVMASAGQRFWQPWQPSIQPSGYITSGLSAPF
jgi:hypothetical protein